MKRIAKVLGLVGGAVAILWAMRDRFISVAASREPEPPVFRAAPVEGASGLDVVDGIGPVLAGRLKSAGIDDMAKLAASSPDAVAEAAGVSAARARAWIEQARSLV
ncbi:MAG TPA: helix-hairpin-helix domain-containing protein [Acidimicrobiia bacterium]|jgi:predicted flap endonuclease-1-like 5' DNA nuclease